MICIIEAGRMLTIAATAFTLSWMHSVERVQWQEDWHLTPLGLHLAEARIQGSGAGMEPPERARLESGSWIYRPQLPPQTELFLASSGATVSGWKLCSTAGCVELGADPAEPVRIAACER
jgi:hypothetical protein